MQLDSLNGELIVGFILGSLSGAAVVAVYLIARACASQWRLWITFLGLACSMAAMTAIGSALSLLKDRAVSALWIGWIGGLALALLALTRTLKLGRRHAARISFDRGHVVTLILFSGVAPGAILVLLWDLIPTEVHPLFAFLLLQAFFLMWFAALALGHFSWLIVGYQFYSSEDVRLVLARETVLQQKSLRLLECLEAYDRYSESKHSHVDSEAPRSHADR